MSGGMPELGSKISLISKADIRYEGRLYTVDPQECTIALSNVRSFGTEDRETQFQIAPQSQIYDYILFRGSDIKDIRVVNNSLPHPNDPAIMQVQLPNGQHLMPHFPMPTMSATHVPPMGGGYPFGGLGALGLGGAGPAPPSMAPGAGIPGPFMLGNQQHLIQKNQQPHLAQQQQKQQMSFIDMLAGSRSTTPISLISRKSPSGEAAMQQLNQQQAAQQNNHIKNNQHHPNQNIGGGGQGGNARDAGHKQRQGGQGGQAGQPQRMGGNNNQRNNAGNNGEFYHPQRDRRDSGRQMDNYNNQHDGRYGGNNYGNQRNPNQNRSWTMHRGNGNNPNNMMRNRGGGGRGRMPNQGFRPMGVPGGTGNQNKPRPNKNTIKFDQDFDFEQANNQFEELRSQLSKLKVGEEPKPTEQMNGEVDKKDDSGNETGAGDHEHEEEEISVGYDKTKSFFDNISCEAAQDRSKNKKNDWLHERKLNSETFGVSSTRRGGYRGRPNYYNRNAGYNTGYNRGYRNNYRNRSNNRMGNNVGGTNRENTNNANAANTNASNPTNGSSTTKDAGTNLKNQAQVGGNAAAAGAVGSSKPSAASATVASASVAHENKTPQQQAAVVGAGQ